MDCRRAADFPAQHPCACCGLTGGVVAVIAFLLAFSSLEYTELGLNYSTVTNTVEDKGYTAGRFFLGLGHSFIKFPATVQTIQFSDEADSSGPSLRSRTSDGLEVVLEISFQYQVNASVVYKLYEKYGTSYDPVYVSMAIDLVTSMATEYNATAFFNDRTTIGLAMEDNIKSVFSTSAYVSVPYFQLRSVGLPADFEKAIQDTEVANQDIQTAHAERDNQEVQQMTKVLQAQQQALSIGLAANASAQTTLLNMDAYVEQFKLAQSLQAESFKDVYQKLGNDEALLLEYMRTRAMRDHPDHLTVVSMPSK